MLPNKEWIIRRGHWLCRIRSMMNISERRKEDQKFEFPIGFRFCPTDEELINHYLTNKVADNNFNVIAIAEVNMSKCEPWDLPRLAKMGETEWYFYSVREKKYPTSLRANRATNAGYWKATGADKEITKKESLIGMKKALVFHKGRAPKGEKTNWVMHEYRLEGSKFSEDLAKQGKREWVVCRVYERSPNEKKTKIPRLPILMNSSPTNNETRTNFGDYNVGSKEASILNSSSSPFGTIPIPNGTPLISNQALEIANHIGSSEYYNCVLPQYQSIPILENNGSSVVQNQNAGFSMGQDFGDVDISSLIDNNYKQEFSPALVEPFDVDSLWN